MHKNIYAIVLCAVLSLGCSGIKIIDGNTINYPNGESFTVDKSFTYVGSVPFSPNVQQYDGPRTDSGVESIYVYVRVAKSSGEYSDIVAVQSFTLPPRWYMRGQGVKQHYYYKFNTDSNVKLKALLLSSLPSVDSSFYCGEFYKVVYDSGSRSIHYCVPSSAVSGTANRTDSVAAVMTRNVLNNNSNTVFAPPVIPSAVRATRPLPDNILDGLTDGRYVALTYSKTLNKVFHARSDKSVNDAFAKSATICNAEDCRSIYVTNDNGCVAFSKSGKGPWGKARGANAQEATTLSLKLCNDHAINDDCSLIATLCPAN